MSVLSGHMDLGGRGRQETEKTHESFLPQQETEREWEVPSCRIQPDRLIYTPVGPQEE